MEHEEQTTGPGSSFQNVLSSGAIEHLNQMCSKKTVLMTDKDNILQ